MFYCMALMNQFPPVVITMQTAYYWQHCWKNDRDKLYLRCMVRYFRALHLSRCQLTWGGFEGRAGDRPQCLAHGAPYVYRYVLQLHNGDHLSQLNTGRAVWNILIQSRAGASGSSVKWYIAPCSL